MNLFFPAGTAPGTIMCATFVIVDDNEMESTEAFTVTATGGMFLFGQSSVQVNIVDNDGEQGLGEGWKGNYRTNLGAPLLCEL